MLKIRHRLVYVLIAVTHWQPVMICSPASLFTTFANIVGFEFLSVIHINDSKAALSSRVDHHTSLGAREIGWDCFNYIMQDCRFDNVPLLLETTHPNIWSQEIQQFKK